jgi:hypothetical protein
MIMLPPPEVVWQVGIPAVCSVSDPSKQNSQTIDSTVNIFYKNLDGFFTGASACLTWNQITVIPTSERLDTYFIDMKYPNTLMPMPEK